MYTLKPYQQTAVDTMCHRFNLNSLLAADMGLGKTVMTLEAARVTPSAWPLLVVCPSMVKDGWYHTAMDHLGMCPVVLAGETPMKLVGSRKSMYVINYDIITHWQRPLRKVGFGCLVLDECQNIANLRAKWTKACLGLAERIPHRVALSGTPMMNRPIELYPVLDMLNPGKWGSYSQFGHKYCDAKWTPWGWQYRGATNLDQLHAKAGKLCMIRIRKHVVENLEAKRRRLKMVELSNRDEYQSAVKDFIAWLSTQDFAAAKRARKAAQLSKMAHLRKLTARLKCRAVVGWINDWLDANPNRKLVVVGWHQKMLDVLHRRCAHPCVVIHGGTTMAQRRRRLAAFKSDKHTRLLIGNIRTLGVGVDGLQHVCRDIVFAELPWRPSDCMQAEDRCYRIGQKEEVRITYLIARDTIEEQMCRILQLKQTNVSTFLDGQTAKQSDLAIYDQLVSSLVH